MTLPLNVCFRPIADINASGQAACEWNGGLG